MPIPGRTCLSRFAALASERDCRFMGPEADPRAPPLRMAPEVDYSGAKAKAEAEKLVTIVDGRRDHVVLQAKSG